MVSASGSGLNATKPDPKVRANMLSNAWPGSWAALRTTRAGPAFRLLALPCGLQSFPPIQQR
eukprot:11183982-Lingulodinium_polyedra.AAC.1